MSVNIGSWLGAGGGTPTDKEGERAALAYRRIQDKPTSVAFRTPAGATLAAQMVRIESDTSASMAESAAGAAAKRKVIVFGIRNHATLPNTQVGEGYRFIWAEDQYTVVDVILTLGEVQAICEVVG